MLRFLPVLLLAGFVLEIASIIWVGGAVGALPAILLLIAGGAVGISVFRSAGSNAASALRSSIQHPGIQRNVASTALLRVFAGVLFISPGFFSDAFAILLLLPPVQQWLVSKIKAEHGFPEEGQASTMRRTGIVIEGEVVEIESETVQEHQVRDRRVPF